MRKRNDIPLVLKMRANGHLGQAECKDLLRLEIKVLLLSVRSPRADFPLIISLNSNSPALKLLIPVLIIHYDHVNLPTFAFFNPKRKRQF